MIFDNVPDDNMITCWPRGNQGSLLITTRYPILQRQLGARSLALGPIDDNSATRILLSSMNRDELPSGYQRQAMEICHRLGNWPLALSQISGYMSEAGCSLSEFMELYSDYESQQEVHESSVAKSTIRYANTIAIVFLLSADVLEKKCKESVLTLFLMVFLSRDGKIISIFLVCPLCDGLRPYSSLTHALK